MKKNIIWLASYPKSGNTWFRAFLTALRNEKDEKLNLNNMKTDGIFSSRLIFDLISGISAADLTWEEEAILRPKVFEQLAQENTKELFIKAHDAYTLNTQHQPLFPTTVSKSAIYFIRNPLDVAVSYAHHNGHEKVEDTIEWMCSLKHGLCYTKKHLHNQLYQQLFDWSTHVKSWVEQTAIPLHIMRYEDMKLHPITTFTKAVQALGFNYTSEEIKAAITATDFQNLKKLEEKTGFSEGSTAAKLFFRKGQIGSWRAELSEKNVQLIIEKHGAMMKKFKYLNDNNQLVF